MSGPITQLAYALQNKSVTDMFLSNGGRYRDFDSCLACNWQQLQRIFPIRTRYELVSCQIFSSAWLHDKSQSQQSINCPRRRSEFKIEFISICRGVLFWYCATVKQADPPIGCLFPEELYKHTCDWIAKQQTRREQSENCVLSLDVPK